MAAIKFTPKYNFFHRKRTLDIQNREDADDYIRITSKRHYFDSGRAQVVGWRFYILPINVIRSLTVDYLVGDKMPAHATRGAEKMFRHVLRRVHSMTEQKRLVEIADELSIDDRIRIIDKWVQKNIGNPLDENYSKDMLRFILVVHSLGFYPSALIDLVVERVGEMKLEKNTEKLLDTLEVAADFSIYVFGVGITVVDGIRESIKYMYHKRNVEEMSWKTT